jgi:hypothetical protein
LPAVGTPSTAAPRDGRSSQLDPLRPSPFYHRTRRPGRPTPFPSLSTDARESLPPSPFHAEPAAQAHAMSSSYQPKPIVHLATGDPATAPKSSGEAAIASESLSLCRSSPIHDFLTSSSPHLSCRSTLKPLLFTGVSLPSRKRRRAAWLCHPTTPRCYSEPLPPRSCSAYSPHPPGALSAAAATLSPLAHRWHPRRRVDRGRGDHTSAGCVGWLGHMGHRCMAMGCIGRPPPRPSAA